MSLHRDIFRLVGAALLVAALATMGTGVRPLQAALEPEPSCISNPQHVCVHLTGDNTYSIGQSCAGGNCETCGTGGGRCAPFGSGVNLEGWWP